MQSRRIMSKAASCRKVTKPIQLIFCLSSCCNILGSNQLQELIYAKPFQAVSLFVVVLHTYLGIVS